jgi:GTPase KRas protein
VGKSALTCRYVFKKFQHDYTSTIEDIYTKKTTIDGELAELDILDTAGRDEFRAVKESKIKEREGFIIVFDLSDANSLKETEKNFELVSYHHEGALDVPKVLIGNKSDKVRAISREEAEMTA